MFALVMLFIVFVVALLGRQHFFATRLKKEMPIWVEQGWVEQAGAENILMAVAGNQKHGISTAFSILGVLLFGAGVISFVASNWDEISKFIKLVILFVSMWAAFAGALWCRLRDSYAWLSEAILLLGVILFGVNIMLIAQIYHIDSHYPDGVLVWALGGLLVAWLMQSKPSFVASSLLMMLWTGMESFGFGDFHWQFMLVWAFHVVLLVRYHWHGLSHLLAAAFLLWTAFSFFSLLQMSDYSNVVYLTQSYFIFYLILFLLGMHLQLKAMTEHYGEIIQKYTAMVALACFYILTFPDFLQGNHWAAGSHALRAPADNLWLWITAELFLVLMCLALWHRKRTLQEHTRQAHHIWGFILLGVSMLVMVVNMLGFVEGSVVAVMFNVIYFAMLIWLIFFGMHTANSPLVNISFMFFGVTLLSRYFDTFWELLDRSLFFMAGGALLIILGIILEKKRRKVVAGITHKDKVVEEGLS
ncbi:DUF2157 domain-containing protein [bacterium AH-315-G11]|nr:DUF2157 domain-containing protein [bacterium AH-315-G11]